MAKQCAVQMDDGTVCGRLMYTAGLCGLHYARRRNGSPPMGSPFGSQTQTQQPCLYCDEPAYSKGMCTSHLQRVRENRVIPLDAPIRKKGQSDEAKVAAILARAIPTGDCLYAAEVGSDGYATSVKDKAGRSVKTHRLVYRVMVGDPGSKHVHHACGHRRCIKPGHLVPASQLENVAEMHARKWYEARIAELEAEVAVLRSQLTSTNF